MSNNIEGSTFSVKNSLLIRSVIPRMQDRGQKPYKHSCTKECFEKVCHSIDDRKGKNFSGEDIAKENDLAFSQVSTAMAFLSERGCVERDEWPFNRLRVAAAPIGTHLDGMIEFCALEESH